MTDCLIPPWGPRGCPCSFSKNLGVKKKSAPSLLILAKKWIVPQVNKKGLLCPCLPLMSVQAESVFQDSAWHALPHRASGHFLG